MNRIPKRLPLQTLSDHFAHFGPCTVEIVRKNRKTSRARGDFNFAFVEFENELIGAQILNGDDHVVDWDGGVTICIQRRVLT